VHTTIPTGFEETVMGTVTKPALNPQTFGDLIAHLRADETELNRATQIVKTNGVTVFADEFFVLTDQQHTALAAATSNPAEDFRWRALVSQALATGTPLSIIPRAQDGFGVNISVRVGSDGSVSVDVGCEV
jgi:hypothetical protein